MPKPPEPSKLPTNFQSPEHLQDTIMTLQNKIIFEEFKDLGDDKWEKSILRERESLRTACQHRDEDSTLVTLLRLWLFYGIMRKAADFHPAIYGIPTTIFQETNKFHPQVHLYFVEKYSDAEKGYEPLRSQVSFRLMNEKSTTITINDLRTIATSIKRLFATGTPFSWKRGKELARYIDPPQGYHFQLYVFSETEAKKVIKEVLAIKNQTPDWKHLSIQKNEEPAEAYPTIPPNQTILGKVKRSPRRRPVGTVHFQSATVHLHGEPTPIVLIDINDIYAKALIH